MRYRDGIVARRRSGRVKACSENITPPRFRECVKREERLEEEEERAQRLNMFCLVSIALDLFVSTLDV